VTGTPGGSRRTARPSAARRSLWAAVLAGAGAMAAIDEIVFHQILGWHHFVDRSTTDVGLLSDGVLHAVELVAIVAGVVLLVDARRLGLFDRRHAVAGALIGLGGFQVFDGVVHHKVLGLHQVRYDVDLLPYDLAWIGGGVLLLLAGLVALALARRPA